MDALDDFGMEQEREWEDTDHGPWNEQKWESFLVENEQLKDKYQEVFEEGNVEKYKHPLDLYYKVHYDLEPDEDMDVCRDRDCELCEDKYKCESYYLEHGPIDNDDPETLEIDEDDFEEFQNEQEENRRKLESINCYQAAKEFYQLVSEFAQKHFSDTLKAGNRANPIIRLETAAFQIQANIISGHCLGYDDEAICGNIVKCKWTIPHLETITAIINKLQDEYPGLICELVEIKCAADNVKAEILQWIDHLRSKVWWQ